MTTAIEHIIDCDANPNMLDGYFDKVIEHKKMGQLILDFSMINLYLPANYEAYDCDGRMWECELRSLPVLNANVLDYLMAHPEIIPDTWKKRLKNGQRPYIFFWGTIYLDGGGHYNVRFLGWDDKNKKWAESLVWLDAPTSFRSFAAILENQFSLPLSN